MGTDLLYTSLFRIVLPAGLLATVLFRYNLFSFIYLLFLLIHPFLPPLTSQSFENGHPRRFIQALLGISALICFAQIVFQIVWLCLTSYNGEFFNYCTTFGQILFNIGFNRMDGLPFWLDGIRLVGMDLLMLLLTAAIYVTCDKKSQTTTPQDAENPQQEQTASKVYRKKWKRSSEYLLLVGELVFLILLAAAGVLQPSLLSAIYFISFLAIATWLACSKALQKPYFIARFVLLLIAGSHFILVYAYQFSFIQKILPQEDLAARLLGLEYLVSSTPCETARSLHFLGKHWTRFVSPIVLLLLYTHSATMTRYRLFITVTYEERDAQRTTTSSYPSRRVSSVRVRRRRSEGTKHRHTSVQCSSSLPTTPSPSEKFPLLNEEHRQQNYNSIEAPGTSLSPDPEGSMVWSVDVPGTFSEAPTHNKYRQPCLTIFQLIAKGSYIGTLIIMMAWSITYHSWLTFILLVGSCVLWMTPDSRGNCLRSSPFLVAYAEALLLLQYIYSLNLKEDELPSVNLPISMKDIGVIKYYEWSFQPLSIKILFTIMFWLTLWFYIEEKKEKRGAMPSQEVSPPTDGLLLDSFQQPQNLLTPGGNEGRRSLVHNNPWLLFIGHQLNSILAKYWIWIVACMLMVISLGGQKVVIYRIVYMIFFLYFILMFQFSYQTWRKVIKVFWVSIIIYSMFVLLLIYTYQFGGVPDFLSRELNISETLQNDFGLETYPDSGVLLSKLLTPTFFLIITIIQLHYFHQQFLIISNINLYRPVEREYTQETIVEESDMQKIEVEECPQTHRETVSLKMTTSHSSFLNPEDIMAAFQKLPVNSLLKNIWELFWRYLEIHINKIVLFSMLCLAIYDACPLHILYLVFALVALPLPSLQRMFCHCGAILTSILLLLKMLYQLHFARQYPFVWVTNCTNMTEPPFDKEINNVEWIGLKTGGNLVSYCQGYIGLIVVLTLQAVTIIRQRIRRYQNNLPDPLPDGILFPDVTRTDADKSLKLCAKYLANFTFYKFGLEICFIISIISIGIRMDIFALLSTFWLFGLFLLKRSNISKFWPAYILYQEITLTIQFLMMIGLPPGLCYEYPWHFWQKPKASYEVLSKWLFLPNYTESMSPNFLIADVVLLIFCCCQAQVFLIEKSPNAETYAGGSNKELSYTSPLKDNPMDDFVTSTKSYLDILKVSVFFSFYWITLAVLFMAGAGSSRISIFAMGYVIGCFFYLWSGNEFYLKPRAKLIKMWNSLLVYNLIVVILKTFFQVIIPTFKNEMERNSLWWIVQLVNNNLTTDGSENMTDEQALMWDALCFAFLIIQRRIFSSHYFEYVILEMTAQKMLASRGAELINELQAKIIHEQRQKETENMEKIKKKMDKIRDQQKSGRYIEPKDHYAAIRSGDYFLFDEVPSADLETLDYVHTPDDHEVKTKGINALISQTMKGTYKPKAERQESSEGDDVGESSRLSPILSADRSSSYPESSPIQTTSSPIPGRKKSSDTPFIEVPISPQDDIQAERDVSLEEKSIKEEKKDSGPSLFVQICNFLRFMVDLLNSVLISATDKLNRISKDYRFVAERLTYEKLILKEKILEGKSPTETILKRESTEQGDSSGQGDFNKHQPVFIKFLVALWYALISQSEILCYMVIIVYQIECSSLLSLPLPLLTFLWGSLAVPRPTKTFWVTIITYTETIVIIKFFFQFNFWEWNKEPCRQPDDPYRCPQLIIGISKENYNVVLDLMLLLAVFFHRFMLKSFGLWRNSNSNIEDPDLETKESQPPLCVDEDHQKEENDLDQSDCSEFDLEDDQSSSNVAKFGEIISSYFEPLRKFFHNLYSQERLTDDVYAYMFFCDFINFLILVFGYNAFGMAGSGTVTSYIEENRIPVPFLAMLLAQFAAIVVDRALYLRKHIFGKIIFQIIMIIVIHIWMFFLLPAFTHKPFYEAIPPKLWYAIKSIYFLLSAYQVRMGYPIRILGNFFCKKYNYINLVLFKLYLIIPFLYELRALMDWIWTNTSLAVGNWFKMEDIYSHVFVLKCYRRAEDEYPFPRGAPRPALSKYGIGGSMLIFMILVIWFPLVFFALGNTVGKRNPPLSSDLKLSISGFQPIFTVTAENDSFLIIKEDAWKEFYRSVTRDLAAATFLNRYEREDITVVPFQVNALATWSISPPSRKLLIKQLQDQNEIRLTVAISFTRSTEISAISDKTVTYEYSQRITNKTILNDLIDMINITDSSVHKVTFHKPFLPLFLVLSDKEPVKNPSDLSDSDRNLSLSLKTYNNSNLQWWQATDGSCNSSTKTNYYDPLGLKNACDYIYVLAFNNKSFPRELFLFSNYGIIGLYTTFVLLLHRIIRSFLSGTSFTIMFDDMPNVDRVLELCLDIYMVRENQELALEEDLFAKLIFLYRSPETLIKWTRSEENAGGNRFE